MMPSRVTTPETGFFPRRHPVRSARAVKGQPRAVLVLLVRSRFQTNDLTSQDDESDHSATWRVKGLRTNAILVIDTRLGYY